MQSTSIRVFVIALLATPLAFSAACSKNDAGDDLPTYDAGDLYDGSISQYDSGGYDGGGSADSGSDVAPATCNGLAAGTKVPSPGVTDFPTLSGGPIVDGTYVLVAAEAVGTADGGPGMDRSSAIRFQGKNVAWLMDLDGSGNPKSRCCTGSYAVPDASPNVIALGVMCDGDGGSAALYQNDYESFKGDAGKNVFRMNVTRFGANYVETYEMQ